DGHFRLGDFLFHVADVLVEHHHRIFQFVQQFVDRSPRQILHSLENSHGHSSPFSCFSSLASLAFSSSISFSSALRSMSFIMSSSLLPGAWSSGEAAVPRYAPGFVPAPDGG